MPSLPLIRRVRFDLRPWGDSSSDRARELLPIVDNVSLVDLVSGYEHAAGFDVPGAYAGPVLDHFKFGDLTAYLIGQPDATYWANKGVVALLGCDCGEVGCWPLESQVLIENDLVTRRGFAQPFRSQHDYGSFGPFTFRRSQYDGAVREAAAAVSECRDY
ncbi:hypothetical protein AB0M36_12770 [Actinoplanes sp. NPDC051346]|uniref:hypothetical protein n=1 Tax=Actinoplanes sp. NPDC051346 TaxID=3155048 RepID=UPI003430B486